MVSNAALDLNAYVTWCYAEYAHEITSHLTRVYGSSADAEDVTHEAFDRFYRELLAHKWIEKPRAWLFTVARRLMSNRLKRARLHVAKLDELARDPTMRPEPVATPEHELTRQEGDAKFNAELCSLSPLQQTCFRLRRLGWTFEQIGDHEDVRLDKRRVIEVIRRTVATLRERLRD